MTVENIDDVLVYHHYGVNGSSFKVHWTLLPLWKQVGILDHHADRSLFALLLNFVIWPEG